MSSIDWLDAIDFERLGLNPNAVSDQAEERRILDLVQSLSAEDTTNRDQYDSERAVEIYRNFLNWLFATFKTRESEFRHTALSILELQPGQRVLITSCGLGEDVELCAAQVGSTGFVHAQDLSRIFVEHARDAVTHDQCAFTVSNALDLPYKDNFFDAVYHFGGINLFGNLQRAVHEMTRVCKTGGTVVFGDESVAPHLRDHDYGKMFICNNALWEAPLPLDALPITAHNVSARYLLGNCFYQIAFQKGEGTPDVDIDIPHISHRGGSVRTRYFGTLEGVSEAAKARLYEYARAKDMSVSDALDQLIRRLDED